MIDLGLAPLANAYLSQEALGTPERSYPLRVLVCEGCWLAQVEDFSKPDEIFQADYAYFSGYSSTWVSDSQRRM